MSQKEAPRIGLLKALGARLETGREVATALDVTVRQVWRPKRRVASAGAEGLLHRGRGRPSPRRQRVSQLLTTTYRDVNDCHATETRQEVEGLALSRPTVRRLRQALGRPAKHRRRPRQYRGPAASPAPCTATPHCSAPSPPSPACRWPSTATASTSSSATTPTGRSRNSCAGPRTLPTSAGCSRASGSASSPPAPPGQGPHRAPVADPAGSPRQRAAPAAPRHARGRQCVPARVPRRLQPALRPAPRRAPDAGASLAHGLLAPQSRALPHLARVTFPLIS